MISLRITVLYLKRRISRLHNDAKHCTKGFPEDKNGKFPRKSVGKLQYKSSLGILYPLLITGIWCFD